MWLQIFFVAVTAISIEAINVQIENYDKNIPAPMQLPIIDEHSQTIPIYYANDGANVESFLVPQNPQRPEEILHDVTMVTPAGYLLPPAVATQNEFYYKPTEPGEQTDWYPIAASPQKQVEVVPVTRNERPVQEVRNLRTPKFLESSQIVPIPSRDLLPPREDAINHFVVLPPSVELELPLEERGHTLNGNPNVPIPNTAPVIKYPVKLRPNPPVLPLDYITPPKNPTRLYPKKYQSEFRPVPIPISQVDEASDDVQDERPTNVNNEYPHNPQYEEVEGKQNLKGDQDAKVTGSDDESYKERRPLEQETSASHYGQPERASASHNGQPEHYAWTYPSKPFASLKQKPSKSNGERTEFRMHGMKGPNSYQFGFDTGKGKNRQFRYEERDNDGHVRGHYGYVDKFGKLRVVNYDADPKLGFRAEVPQEKE